MREKNVIDFYTPRKHTKDVDEKPFALYITAFCKNFMCMSSGAGDYLD